MSQSTPYQSKSGPAGLDLPPGSGPAIRFRHPLGLPRGSVRAVLAFMVLGTVWALLLIPAEKIPSGLPPYLLYLTFLIVGCYFGSRAAGKGSGERHPLFLPRGSIRILIVLGFVATFAVAYHHDHEFYKRIHLGHAAAHPLLPFLLFGGFFLGAVVNGVAEKLLKGPIGMPAWYQDVLAWVSVLAVFGLTFGLIYQLVIVPHSATAEEAPQWLNGLAAVVAFYFGART